MRVLTGFFLRRRFLLFFLRSEDLFVHFLQIDLLGLDGFLIGNYCVTFCVIAQNSGFRLKRPLIRRSIGYKDQYFWSQNVIMQ